MNIIRDIQSLSTFKQNASRIVKEIQETREPVVLTVNGKAAVVIQDAESYQRMIDQQEYNETVAVLRERLKDMDDPSPWIPAEEAFDGLRKKYGLSFSEK
jgi:prevent-host-death family protein